MNVAADAVFSLIQMPLLPFCEMAVVLRHVALFLTLNTGFAVLDTYGNRGWAQFGGTSAGTPQWAALVAIVNQGRTLAGKTKI